MTGTRIRCKALILANDSARKKLCINNVTRGMITMEENRLSQVPYDLLIRGGTVIDPAQNIHRVMDVAIKNGKVAALSERIDERCDDVIDASGLLVVPGLVDLHTHIYWGGNPLGVHPEPLFAKSGATTLVDAGSAGAGNFQGLKAHIIDAAPARILAFLNIGFAGMFGFLGPGRDKAFSVGNLCDIRLANIRLAVQAGRTHPELIVGIKITASIVDGCDWPGLDPVYIARRAAEELGKPLMVHIGTAPPTTEALLPLLRCGDILTHSFRGNPNSLLDGKGRVLPEAVDARQRGVIFDLGHGAGSFAFDTARRMLDAGFPPDVISSDVHAFSIDGPAFDLPTTMSKMLNLGLELDDVIGACTCNPARAIGRERELGSLEVGRAADVGLLTLLEGEFVFRDAENEELRGGRKLSPAGAIFGGKRLPPAA